MDAGEVAQEETLGAVEFVIPDVIGERPERFEHFACDGFGADVFLSDPGMAVGEGVEGGVDEFAFGLGVFELIELIHAILVFDALGLHFGDALALEFVQLPTEDDVGIFEDGLDEGDEIERVIRGVGIEQGKRFEEVEGEHLVHGKVILQLDVDAQIRVVRVGWDELDDLAIEQGTEQLPGAAVMLFFGFGRFMATVDELAHGATAVTGAAENVQQHAVGDLEPGGEALWRRRDQALEGILVPGHKIAVWRFAFDELLAAPGGFFLELTILDHVFGGLDHDPAAVVESFASGAAADLVEIAGAEDDGFLSVEFAEAGEEDGADGDIDADAEGIGAADDFEETALGELFDEDAVFGEQAGVMNADAVFKPGADAGTVGAGEVEAFE